MREDNYPHPVSEPAAEGLPDYADDDSKAYDEVLSPRIADGPQPAPLPADHPTGADRYGTTPEEARHGESLDYKLAREEPDDRPKPALADEGNALTDAVDEPDPDTAMVLAQVPVDGNDHSPVSLLEGEDEQMDPGRPVGRIVEPDEGAHPDEEADAIAYDAGAAGGGPTAEESAMHEYHLP
jgi:uncharacterized protein DUF5709